MSGKCNSMWAYCLRFYFCSTYICNPTSRIFICEPEYRLRHDLFLTSVNLRELGDPRSSRNAGALQNCIPTLETYPHKLLGELAIYCASDHTHSFFL